MQSLNLQQVRIGFNDVVNDEIVANPGLLVFSKSLKGALYTLINLSPFFSVFGLVFLRHVDLGCGASGGDSDLAVAANVIQPIHFRVRRGTVIARFYHRVVSANTRIG